MRIDFREALAGALWDMAAVIIAALSTNLKLDWQVWNALPHPDGMTIYDPDGFRFGKPTIVTWAEFERARCECTLVDRREISG